MEQRKFFNLIFMDVQVRYSKAIKAKANIDFDD